MTAITEAKPSPAEKVVPLTRDKRAAKHALVLEEQKRRPLWIEVAPGVTQDDVRSCDYWYNVAPQLSRHDLVTLYSGEGWEMLVCIERVRTDGCEISVRKISGRVPENDASEPADDDGKYRVEYRGPDQWCVRRLADNVLMQKNHPQKSGALAAFRASQPRKAA